MDGHIYIFVPDPQTHGPHGPTCKRTDGHTDGWMDTQKHRQTRRRVDRHVEARTQTHGCRRRSTDADADARMQTQAPDGAQMLNIRACSAWVEKSSRRILRLDERTRTFEVYYRTNYLDAIQTHRSRQCFPFGVKFMIIVTQCLDNIFICLLFDASLFFPRAYLTGLVGQLHSFSLLSLLCMLNKTIFCC